MSIFNGLNKFLSKAQDNRALKIQTKGQTNAILATNGIDPKSALWNGISNVANSAGAAVVGTLGKPGSTYAGAPGAAVSQSGEGSGTLKWIGIAVAAFFIGKFMKLW